MTIARSCLLTTLSLLFVLFTVNWYQTDGTYSGGVSDFQTGWKVVAAAIEEHAPETKMYWSPNVGSDADYEKYYPKEGRVDIVGVSPGFPLSYALNTHG